MLKVFQELKYLVFKETWETLHVAVLESNSGNDH